jgi:hypothetical protein
MLHAISDSGLQTVASDVPALINCDPNSTWQQLTLLAGTATAGTLTLTQLPEDGCALEPVTDIYGAAVTQNLASVAQKTWLIQGNFSRLNVACASSNGTYKYVLKSW